MVLQLPKILFRLSECRIIISNTILGKGLEYLNLDFSTRNLRYEDRARDLAVEAAGVVKSEKHYPVFDIDGDEYIFKPISQSKPFATAFFPLAEAFWSQLLPQYFNVQMPQYYLAECIGYHDEAQKYLDTGCISENALASGEHLVNLLEWFNAHPDPAVDIANYENFCYMYYEYVPIFESQLFQSRKNLAEQLAMQVLLSILTKLRRESPLRERWDERRSF